MYTTTKLTVCPFSNKHSAALMSLNIMTNGFRAKRSSAGCLLELDPHQHARNFNYSDIINNFIDYEDGQEERNSLRADKTRGDPAFHQIGKEFS
ncbi:hypothetical protein TNCV_665931 [Trichonephila clavipes]|uniref:Uncharacterized protein n=1 Tax=Trichonephila clavipes TaxID=2585209 RepID=A0A8X6SKA9_TRICX|nr:hypothetical protein TNCV_665931 [Trichonephila clavipes]